MLQLRPICENCAKPLPPEAQDARICSFECTFCSTCVEGFLHNVCPNCGGGFEKRPVRPNRNWRGDNDVAHNPPVEAKKHKPVDPAAHDLFSEKIKPIPSHLR